MELNTPVRYIKGIGEKKAQAFEKLGVFSLYDLISFFPRKYEDRSTFRRISEIANGESEPFVKKRCWDMDRPGWRWYND